MRILKSVVIYLLLGVIILACNKSTVEKETYNLNPTSINVFLYRDGSTKVQPELIKVESDPQTMKQALDWKKDSEPTAMPSTYKIDHIYVLQYFYGGENLGSEYYMYVTDDDGNNYIKQFEYNSSYDSYEGSKTKEEIMSKVGPEGWNKVAALELLLQ